MSNDAVKQMLMGGYTQFVAGSQPGPASDNGQSTTVVGMQLVGYGQSEDASATGTPPASSASKGSVGAAVPTSEAKTANANTLPIWLIGAGIAVAVFFAMRFKGFQTWIGNLKLAKKLALGFGVALFGTAVVGGFGMVAKEQLHGEGEQLVGDIIGDMDIIGVIETGALAARIQILNTVHAETDEAMDIEAAMLDPLLDGVDEALKSYDGMADDPQEIKLLAEIDDAWAAQSILLRQIETLALAGEEVQARVIEDQSEVQFENVFLPAINALEAWGDGEADFAASDLTRVNVIGTTKMIVVFVVVALFSVMMAMAITGAMTGAVKALIEQMTSLKDNCLANLKASIDALKTGDLTKDVVAVTEPIENCGKDEVGDLGRQFNGLLDQTTGMIEAFTASQDSLKTMMRDLVKEATFVKDSGGKVEAAMGETSKASEQITGAMDEMTQSVTQGAKTSQEIASGAGDLATNASTAANAVEGMLEAIGKVKSGSEAQQAAGEEAGRTAKEGGEAVQQAISSMAKIQEQVELSNASIKELGEKQAQIGSIVNSIDEIAEQTNLLALNAAIEAARAGEHGRGFAVVAEEVRKLAERAGTSTSEIGEMIKEINAGVEQSIAAMQATSEEVESGAEYSAKANEALQSILSAVETFGTLAADSQEQVEAMSKSAEEVNASVESVASISQQTAAGAQELSAGNEQMSANVEESAASIQEQSANIEQVSNMAKELSSAGDRLQALAAQFKYEESGSRAARPAEESEAA